MTAFRTAVDLGQAVPGGSAFDKTVFHALAMAVQRVAEAAQQTWVSYASGAPMPDGSVIHVRTGEYARSISLRRTGDFAAEVASDSPYTRAIKDGSPARDLKAMLPMRAASASEVRLHAAEARFLGIVEEPRLPLPACCGPVGLTDGPSHS